MIGARQWHGAVLLNTSSNATTSGKVLVAGGRSDTSTLDTAQLYSPTAGTWAAAGNLNAPRQQHTATLLPNGKVLVAGGVNGTATLATAATYDPSSGSGTWSSTSGAMPSPLKFHTATLLATSNAQLNGKVLVAGGNDGTTTVPAAYLYDPAQNTFSSLEDMWEAREAHTETLLSNGSVLLLGGRNEWGSLSCSMILDTSEGNGTWYYADNMSTGRANHTATHLGNGLILAVGGYDGETALNSAEVFDESTNLWTLTDPLPETREMHTANLLADGSVLVTGGSSGGSIMNTARLYGDANPNACTSNSQCPSGNCVSGTCCNTACADQCSACNLPGLIGTCSPKPNGSTCNDGNLCTQTDTCQSAVCTGSNPVTCTASDACHVAGTCDQATGNCSNPAAPNGTTCSDNNACTAGDSCQSGTCTPGTAVATNDGNPCTTDVCDAVAGVTHTPVAAGTSCSDANACNGTETCSSSGSCLAGTPPTVDDANPCTADACDAVAGVTHTPVAAGTSCGDGNACNGSELCNASGTCLTGTPVTCVAIDGCHLAGTCDPGSGNCSNPTAPNGTECSDNNACTAGDACQSGTCTPGTAVATNDGNPCTADACDPVAGVTHAPVAAGSSCGDGNACNGDEACNASGSCIAGTPVAVDDGNPCTSDSCDAVAGVTHAPVAAGTSCGDGNACNGDETCNGAGACVAGIVPTVDDGNPCTSDSCDAVAGVTHTPLAAGTSCGDANACNGNETCNASGSCLAGTPPTVDDANPCTSDACDPVAGVTHTPVTAGTSCGDGNACNGSELCNASGTCLSGTPVTCVASDGCHIAGTCDPASGNCSNPTAPNGTTCSDNNACTAGDACQSGTCTPGTAVATNDGNPCTADACDPVAGVTHAPVAAGTACGDGNACNGDETCNASGSCIAGTPVAVDDGNPCTSDTCDAVAGVTHAPVAAGTSCGDGNACNGDETCNGAGACVAGIVPTIDDGNPCTSDSCDTVAGVTHTPVAAGTSCSDANACNGSELCNASGTCLAGTPVTCVASDGCHIAGTCDPASGNCSNPTAPNGTGCSDNNACTAGDACQGGTCTPGTAVATNDGNPCTSDSCDPVAGVTHAPVAAGTACGDGNACNGDETCNASGSCIAGTPVAVDDGNPCTSDSCDAVAGVTHAPLAAGTWCGDGNACNGDETCNGAGACVAGTPPSVDDGNPCTSDSCDPVAGVTHAPVAQGTSCSDGNSCNGDELCDAAGACAAGTPPVLSDGNPCTTDTCNPATGVITHSPAPVGTSCTSTDVCYTGQTCDAQGQCQGGTPANVDDGDPSTIDTCEPGQGVRHRKAAAIDKTVITTTLSANQWLFTGADPIQKGVAPGTIELRRACVLHGYVKDRQGAPIPNVAITVLNHPEFGNTITHADGRYDMVVNGGGQLTVKYAKDGLLEAQRAIKAPWDDHGWATDVVMIAADPAVTTIDLTSAAEFQVAQGSIINDADGERQATILFPADNIATMTLEDGTTQTIPTLHVRATEFTVGDSGPSAMPAELPPTTAYTYAVEINADEAVTAGAKSVRFDKALPLYVDNFLGFAPGTTVPMGSYDRELAQWVPEDSGVVISVLDNSGGNVQLDITGTGVPATTTELAAIGVTDGERVQLAGLYSTGDSFWRVQVKHFTSPIDLNWPTNPPDPPPDPPLPPDPPPVPDCTSSCCNSGAGGSTGPIVGGASILKCGEQVYTETIPIGGTPFQLMYGSDRVPGFRKASSFDIPLVGSNVDSRIQKVYVGVRVAGRDFRYEFLPESGLGEDFTLSSRDGDHYVYRFRPSPNLGFPFKWDGKDANGRTPIGPPPATAAVGYFFEGPYWSVDRFGNPRFLGIESEIQSRVPTLSWWRSSFNFHSAVPWDARNVGLGGWTLDVHHTYDPRNRMVEFGGGGHSPGTQGVRVVQQIAGKCTGTTPENTGDGGPASDAKLAYPVALAVGPDGSVYIGEGFGYDTLNRIRVIDPAGVIHTIAGGNGPVTPGGPVTNSEGDGGLAINAHFSYPYDVAVGADGSILVADFTGHRIRRIRTNGIISTIAGTGAMGVPENGQTAVEAPIRYPSRVAAGPNGDIYFVAQNAYQDRLVWRISTEGRIYRVAGTLGNRTGQPDPDEVPATETIVHANDVDVGPDGAVYIADFGVNNDGRVRKVTPDGIIHFVPGLGPGGIEEGFYHNLQPESLAVAPDGIVYVSTAYSKGNVYALKDGVASIIARGPTTPSFPDYLCGTENGKPAVGTTLSYWGVSLAYAPNHDLYYVTQERDSGHDLVMRLSAPYAALGSAEFTLPSHGTNEVFEFDAAGKHLRTRNMTTGATIYSFGYDNNGLVQSITHDNNLQTVIERDASGQALAIVSPYGQRTTLSDYNADGYVGTITDPLGHSVTIGYDTSPSPSVGLVRSFTNQRGYSSAVSYTADGAVIKDEDGAGGFKALSLLQKNVVGSTIQLATAEGVTTLYQFWRQPDGTKQDTTTWPDGTQTIGTLLPSEISQVSMPDGTVIKTTRTPDPTWGMQQPMISTSTVLPSGLTRVESQTRTATTSTSDLAVLTAETVQRAVNGATTRTVFSPIDLKYTTTTPAGRTTIRYVDTNLRTTRIQRPNIAEVVFSYDANGRLSSVTQGTRVTFRTYYSGGDTNGYLQTLTNPLGQTTTFIPDALGRTLQQTLDTVTTTFSWDEANNLASVTPPGKPTHQQTYTPVNLLEDYIPPAAGLASYATNYQYNLDRQLLTETRPDAVVTARSYDTAGRLDVMTMPTGSLAYTYFEPGCTTAGCAAGRLASIAGPGSETLGFTYDGQLQKSTTWSGLVNGAVSWNYDNDFRRIAETVQAGTTTATAAFQYNADSQLTCASPTTCPSGDNALAIMYDSQNGRLTGTDLGGCSDVYGYNRYGELGLYQVNIPGSSSSYRVVYDQYDVAERDALGRVVQKTETIRGTTYVFGYTYDVQGRLTDVTRDGAAVEHYGYDANGNRTTGTVNGATVNPTYDEQDRLLTYGDTVFTYTANGELRTKTDPSGTTTYTYDAVGSLIAVNLPDGRLIEYATDGKGRRIAKMINGVVAKRWLYRDQLKPVAELDGAGNIVSEFIYATKNNVPDLVVRGGAVYRVISDQLGSPVLAVNTSSWTEYPLQARYAVFGERTLIGGSDDWIPFGFAGGLYDPDTKLTRFGARDYDPMIGRWISKDPIRFDGGQSNIYVYVGNDPVNRVDPSGRGALEFWKNLGADILDALKDIFGMAACSKSMGHYQDLERECKDEIQDACSGPCWLDNDQCASYNGGVDKDSIRKCILNKDPKAWNDMMNDCMSI